jgi:hypothetical protein
MITYYFTCQYDRCTSAKHKKEELQRLIEPKTKKVCRLLGFVNTDELVIGPSP